MKTTFDELWEWWLKKYRCGLFWVFETRKEEQCGVVDIKDLVFSILDDHKLFKHFGEKSGILDILSRLDLDLLINRLAAFFQLADKYYPEGKNDTS